MVTNDNPLPNLSLLTIERIALEDWTDIGQAWKQGYCTSSSGAHTEDPSVSLSSPTRSGRCVHIGPHEAREPTPAQGGSHGARDPHRRQGGQRRWHHAFALRGDDACQADDSRWQAVAPRGIVSELYTVGGPSDGIPVRAEEGGGYTSSKLTNQIGPTKARGRQGARKSSVQNFT